MPLPALPMPSAALVDELRMLEKKVLSRVVPSGTEVDDCALCGSRSGTRLSSRTVVLPARSADRLRV